MVDMEGIHQGQDFEAERISPPTEIKTFAPVSEMLLSIDPQDTLLPREVVESSKRKEEAKLRQALDIELSAVFAKLPDFNMNFDAALESGLIGPDELKEVYASLTSFLQQDENNARIILYLPFEILPKISKKDPDNSELGGVKQEFLNIYHQCWLRLLPEKDFRADYVDGDIDEKKMPPPMVCKVAHLVPELVSRGVISVDKIRKIIFDTNDPVLTRSLNEALQVIDDLATNQPASERDTSGEKKIENKEQLHSLADRLANLAVEISKHYEQAKNTPDQISEARAIWERTDNINRLENDFSHRVSEAIKEGKITSEDLIDLTLNSNNEIAKVAGIRAMRIAVESSSRDEPLVHPSQFLPTIESIWSENNQAVAGEIVTTLSHWQKLGLVDPEVLTRFGIKPPDMEANFSAIEEKIKPEEQKLSEIFERIDKDPLLSSTLYRSVLFFGSRLKGYSLPNADLDIAIFIKPGSPFDQRADILNRTNSIFAELLGQVTLVEFWLEEDGDNLKIRNDLPEESSAVANADYVHTLFEGAWSGQEADSRELAAKLLPEYLLPGRKSQDDYQIDRFVWLRELERDTLQYRLMHQGYDRYEPRRSVTGNSNVKSIDGESCFYDPGFRRLATKLFLNKVFIPEISSDRSI